MVAGPVDFFREVLVHDEGKEACEEVCPDPVIPLKIYRPGLEVGLRETEAVLYDPPPAVGLYYVACLVFEVGADAIEAIEAGLLVYHLLVERVAAVLGKLSVRRAAFALYEAPGVVLALSAFACGAMVNDALRPRDLLFPDVSQIGPVFEGECDDEPLLQLLALLSDLYPSLPIEQVVLIFLRVERRKVVLHVWPPCTFGIVLIIEQHDLPAGRLR